jgi:hypothetical protein
MAGFGCGSVVFLEEACQRFTGAIGVLKIFAGRYFAGIAVTVFAL